MCLIQGTPSASQETSESPRGDSVSSRLTPDGQLVTNYMEEKPASHSRGLFDSCIIFYSTCTAETLLLDIYNGS